MKVWSYTYEDHISSIVKTSRTERSFDHLPGKGKPLNLDKDFRTILKSNFIELLANNHVLPRWIELSKRN